MQIDHPILQFKNVSISYTPGKNAVNHVNADIKKNRITAIMGPSGCGKSTLLRASTACTNYIRTSGSAEKF